MFRLNNFTALQQTDDDQDNRDYQQNMEQSAQCVGSDQSQKPENYQYYNYGPHNFKKLIKLKLRRIFQTDKKTNYMACFSPENICISLTIPQAITAYTIMATSVAGSRTEVVSMPWVNPRRNIPSKGAIKIPLKP